MSSPPAPSFASDATLGAASDVPDVPVRVRLIGRDFTLRVRPGDEARTRESVAYVDAKLTAFRKAHPMQNETTAALIVALALGDELLAARRDADDTADAQSHVTDALLGLDLHLAAVLSPRRRGTHASGEASPGHGSADAYEADDWGDEDVDDEGDEATDFDTVRSVSALDDALRETPGEDRVEEPAR